MISEVAFLAMDLIQRGHAGLAFRFVNRYLEHTGDYAGLRLLRYYMVYRALVRAKVAAMRAAQSGVEAAVQTRLQEKCRRPHPIGTRTLAQRSADAYHHAWAVRFR